MSQLNSPQTGTDEVGRLQQHYLGWMGITLLGSYLALATVALTYLTLETWPEKGDLGKWSHQAPNWLSGYRPEISDEYRIMLLMVFVSSLGVLVHSIRSYSSFVGNRRLVASWVWWYLLKIPLASSLSLILYFVIRGGLLISNSAVDSLNPYGLSAIAGLAGMYTDRAADKLREVFDTMLRPPADKSNNKLDHHASTSPQPTTPVATEKQGQ